MASNFELFVGIDWSGAKGFRHKGISVATLEKRKGLNLLLPPGKEWSREDIFNFILETSNKQKALIGVDFAFSYPYSDMNCYFPLSSFSQPKSPFDLWTFIDNFNNGEDDFYGGKIWTDLEYGEYYNSHKKKGKLFQSRRRLTEIVSKKYRSASPVFNCIGPGAVGTGSLAGMRMLHHLKKTLGKYVAIWPFDDLKTIKEASIVIVEIFPSLYFHIAGENSVKKEGREKHLLKNTLKFFGESYSSTKPLGGKDNDDMDALVSCAALKYYSNKQEGFISKFRNKNFSKASKLEGWIFGLI